MLCFLGLLGTACSKKEPGVSPGIDLKEGKWEISIEMESSSYPINLPKQVYTQCLTKENFIPIQEQSLGASNPNCAYKQKEIKGNSVSWVMECKEDDGGKVINEGSLVYKGEQFEGRLVVKSKEVEFVQKIQGKWIGKCDPGR